MAYTKVKWIVSEGDKKFEKIVKTNTKIITSYKKITKILAKSFEKLQSGNKKENLYE